VATVHRSTATLATVIVYGVSLMALYAASSVYHLVRGGEALDRLLRRFDHCAIFLLIAGSYTPMLYAALEGAQRTVYLGIVWAIALGGIVMRIAWLGAPRWLYTAMYLGMGWIGVLEAGTFRRALPSDVIALVVAGGLTYTAGAIIYALKRPNLIPGRFGFHELWHLFVLGASVCHFAAVCVLTRA
jgi:hemolysin III